MGTQLQLRDKKVRLLDERLDAAAEWPAEKIASAEQATNRANTAISKLHVRPNEHSWYGTELGVQNPFDIDRLTERLTKAINELDALSAHLNRVFSPLAGRDDPSLNDAANTAKALHHIASAPVGRAALNHPAWASEPLKIETAIAQGQSLCELVDEFARKFQDDAWAFDAALFFWRYAPTALPSSGDSPNGIGRRWLICARYAKRSRQRSSKSASNLLRS
jgi:hypothetical protein